MATGACLGQRNRKDFQVPPNRFRRAQRAWKVTWWTFLYITVQCRALPIRHEGEPQTWKPLMTSNCSCRNGRPAPSLGTAILSFGSSAGNSADAIWKRFKPAQAGQSLPRLQPGEERKVRSPPGRFWKEQLPIWIPGRPRPCGKTFNGWRSACIAALPGMTVPGSSPRATSSVRSSRCCSNSSGQGCFPICSNASLTTWLAKWRIPYSIWPLPCGTRTTSWFCCRGWTRRSSYGFSNGSNSMRTTSFWPCRDTRELKTPYRRHSNSWSRLQTAMPYPEAQLTHRRSKQIQVFMEGHDAQLDRPGPKSRGARTHLPGSPLEVSFLQQSSSNFYVTSPCVDVRVGGNLGRSPPEAAPLGPQHTSLEAKLNDPSSLLLDALQVGVPGTQPLHVVSQSFNLPAHFLTRRRFRSFFSMAANLLPAQACWLAFVCAIASLICRILALVRTRWGRRHWLWRVVRVCPGIYRRKRCFSTILRGCLPVRICGQCTTRPAVHKQARMPQTQIAPRPFSPRLLFWVAIVLMVRLATAAPMDPRQDTRTLPILRAYGQQAQQVTASCKRSFKRAQCRALRDGSTSYKGRLHTPSSLGLRGIRPHRSQTVNSAPASTSSLRFVTWNAGGLNALRYTELLGWLQQEREAGRPVHVMCVQETKWPYNAEYSHQHWFFVHSGMSQAQGGILFVVSRDIATPSQIRHASLVDGRALHLRVALHPPLDILGVYQHAWSLSSASPADGRSEHLRALLERRASIWSAIRNFLSATPKRNSLVVLGDFNCPLVPCHPHVGPGVITQRNTQHTDQSEFQLLVQSFGITAINTWGRAGPSAGTYLHFQQHLTQIDFILTRLPFRPAEMRTRPLRHSPLVHPTGLRHIPLSGYVPAGRAPNQTQVSKSLTAKVVTRSLDRDPDLHLRFQTQLAQLLSPGADPEDAMTRAWRMCQQQAAPPPAPTSPVRPCLKTFWAAKCRLRQAIAKVDDYHSPPVWHCTHAPASVVRRLLPRTVLGLRRFLECWRASIDFQSQDKALRKRIKHNKTKQVDDLIESALASPVKGLQGLYQLSHQLRPKTPRRSIHFRFPDGRLMTEQEELQSLQEYFRDLYASPEDAPPPWSLQQALHITVEEVVDAFRHLSAKKALPPGQVPAALWKAGAVSLAPHVCDTLNAVLQPGPLVFPASWHQAFITLIPKAGKPPSKPQNLRPISLLPAVPKLLARIAAERLKPYLEQALHNTPQFAYLKGRQVADAIDRVMAHCSCVRAEAQTHDRSVFRLRSGSRSVALYGGLQLSLDLSKAYDRMPRPLLLQSLLRIHTPSDLIALIMYIHDNATLLISRHGSQATASMGQGVRQGCGLSPLLWLGFTLLLFETFNAYLPAQALTGYADDFHVKWVLHSPLDFRNACSQICRMLTDLEAFGMQPAIDKTVIILRLKGQKAPKLLKEFIVKRGQQRFLSLHRFSQRVLLPIKQSHLYLGVKIGYGRFERETVQYRLSQSWVAFYRLHGLLKHPLIPLRKRLLLWQTCVWAITRHGLTSTGLDTVSAERLVAQVHRQLRMVARSPAHVTHESNQDLMARLKLTPPLPLLLQQARKRISLVREHLGDLQPLQVHHWWEVLLKQFGQLAEPKLPSTRLVEVTQVLCVNCTCPTCGQQFPSHHALKVHIGKQHATAKPNAPAAPSTKLRTAGQEQYRQHALAGLPQCKHCLRRFHGWPEFTSHFATAACPVLHAIGRATKPEPSIPTSDPAAAQLSRAFAPGQGIPEGTSRLPPSQHQTAVIAPPSPVPLFHRSELQTLARQRNIPALISAIHDIGSLNHCPECWQWCTSASYVSRHAVGVHSLIQQHQPAVRSWAQSIGRALRPCEWCRKWYKARPKQHVQTCPVMWMCGHFLARHSNLEAPGQSQLHTQLPDDGPPAPRGSGGAQPVWSLHEARAAELHAVDGPALSGRQCGSDPGGDGSGSGQTVPGGRPGPSSLEVGQGGGQRPGPGGEEDGRQARALRQGQLRDWFRPSGLRRSSSYPDNSHREESGGEASNPLHRLRSDGPAGTPGQWGRPKVPVLVEQEGRRPLGQGGGPGEIEGHHSQPHQAGGAAGRCHDHLQPRLRIRVVPPNGGNREPMVRDHRAIQHGPGVEIQEGKESTGGEPTPPQCSFLLHVDNPSGDAGENGGPHQSGCLRESQGDEHHRGPGLRLLALERGGQTPCQGHPGAHFSRAGLPERENDPEPVHVPRHSGALSCAPAIVGQPHRRSGSVPVRHPEPDGGEPADVFASAPAMPMRLHPPYRDDDSSIEDWTQPARCAAREAGPKPVVLRPAKVLTLVLINPGDHCYFNAVCRSACHCLGHFPLRAGVSGCKLRLREVTFLVVSQTTTDLLVGHATLAPAFRILGRAAPATRCQRAPASSLSCLHPNVRAPDMACKG